MEMKRIFSVVVCAVGIFFSMTAESKDGCLKSYVSADSLLLYEYYESHIWVSPLNYTRVFSEQRAVAPDWFHYRDRVIELRVLALRKRIWEEYLRDFPLERLSKRGIRGCRQFPRTGDYCDVHELRLEWKYIYNGA